MIMAKKIVCMDSDYEVVVQLVAEWRRTNLYPQLGINDSQLQILKGNTATRMYLQTSLTDVNVVFFTASGHGLLDEFQGNDGDSALEVGEYDSKEVRNKIIHLLSCNTAFELGADTVNNGCFAFIGYDIPFTFHRDYLHEFMQPDKVLAIAIAGGATIENAHKEAMDEYERMISKLQRKNVPISILTDMMVNQNHFCSPVKDNRWGNPNASL
jgi:hypothetical protein